jgi:hypothetical protein
LIGIFGKSWSSIDDGFGEILADVGELIDSGSGAFLMREALLKE